MLTQLDLLGASGSSGNDEDCGMSVSSPLDDLTTEYPIEQTEFEYFESSLNTDSYYDISPAQDIQDSLPPPPCLTPTTTTPTTFGVSLYDTTISNRTHDLLHDQDDMKPFHEDLKPLNEALEASQDIMSSQLFNGSVRLTDDKIKFEDETSSYSGFATDVYDTSMTAADFNLGSLYETFDANLHANDTIETRTTWDEGACKGKIGPLQRRALDSIFNVTEKPSRGLVLHIASELGLHHLTVKNFFSNGRRRLRRAAARLSDPERTRRENERRKEKRRLAARASAALSNGDTKSGITSVNNNNNNNNNNTTKMLSSQTTVESPTPKDTPLVSLERRALMEKLADKVQRSKAQRSLASDLGMLQATTTSSSDFLTHTTQDLLIQPPNDILSQASHDILSHSSHGLLSELPHDFLAEPSHDLSQGSSSSSSSLLNPNTDPWNFF